MCRTASLSAALGLHFYLRALQVVDLNKIGRFENWGRKKYEVFHTTLQNRMTGSLQNVLYRLGDIMGGGWGIMC